MYVVVYKWENEGLDINYFEILGVANTEKEAAEFIKKVEEPGCEWVFENPLSKYGSRGYENIEIYAEKVNHV